MIFIKPTLRPVVVFRDFTNFAFRNYFNIANTREDQLKLKWTLVRGRNRQMKGSVIAQRRVWGFRSRE